MQKLMKLTEDVDKYGLIRVCMCEGQKVARALVYPQLESDLTIMGDEAVQLTRLLVRKYGSCFPLDFSGIVLGVYRGDKVVGSVEMIQSLLRFIEYSGYNPIVCVTVARAIYKFPSYNGLYSVCDPRFIKYAPYLRIAGDCLYDLFKHMDENRILSQSEWYVFDKDTSEIKLTQKYNNHKELSLIGLIHEIEAECEMREQHAMPSCKIKYVREVVEYTESYLRELGIRS